MKKFKMYDNAFTAREIIMERQRWMDDPNGRLNTWIVKAQPWSQNYVQMCVYELDDAVDWQRFRVCLKGLHTSQKLHMLERYYQVKVVKGEDAFHRNVNRCRVDNYIGALIRGGLLDSSYRVRVRGRTSTEV